MFKLDLIVKSVSLTVLMGTISGCGPVKDMIAMQKISVWRKDNIYVSGYLNRATDKRLYNRINIGTPDRPIEKLPMLYLEWNDGKHVPLSSMNITTLTETKNMRIENICPSIEGYNGSSWPNQTKCFRVYAPNTPYVDDMYYFAVVGDKIISVIIFEKCPGFWNESQTKRYTLPLTQQAVEELFGKPDEIIEYVPVFP